MAKAKTKAKTSQAKTPTVATTATEVVARTAPILLNRDYWDEDGARHAKGEVLKVDVETAKKLIKEGKAERADPLPGENG